VGGVRQAAWRMGSSHRENSDVNIKYVFLVSPASSCGGGRRCCSCCSCCPFSLLFLFSSPFPLCLSNVPATSANSLLR